MSFPDSNLSSFWPIFFNFCTDIDIRKEWFWVADGLKSFINNRVMALDWCKNVFFLNIFRTNGWILIRFCVSIDKYKIHVLSNACSFWSIFIPRHKRSGRVLIYTIRTVWLSGRPSALRFRTLTWVVFDRFSSNFAWALISGRSGLGLHIG